MQDLHRVEKSHSEMWQAPGWQEISRLRVSSKHFPSAPYRHAAPLEMTVAAGAIGHTCGVKVQRERFLRWTGPMGRRVLKFDGLSGRGLWYRPYGAQRTHFEGALATRKM